MGRVIICRDEPAITPYYLAQIGKNIYSMEELCYFFRMNSYMLDKDCMTMELVDWISENFGLEELVRVLRYQIRNNSALTDFVALILRDTAIYPEEINGEIVASVRENALLNVNEKRKKRADYLAGNGLYMAAINEYESILDSDDRKDSVLTGALYHNIGYCYAKMFQFRNAAEYYEKAYRVNGRTTCLLQYLAALKMYLPDDAYRDTVLENLDAVNLNPELEERLNRSMSDWESGPVYQALREQADHTRNEDPAEYHRRQDAAINRLREEYRKSENEHI